MRMVANSCMDMVIPFVGYRWEFEILALDLRDVIRLVLLAILRQEFTGTWARSCLLFLFSRLHLHLHCRFGREWLVPGPWMD